MDINFSDIHSLVPIFGTLIPIVAIVGHFWSESARKKEINETIRQIVAAGQTPPLELIEQLQGDGDEPSERQKTPTRALQSAATLLAVGIGLLIGYYVMSIKLLIIPAAICGLMGLFKLMLYPAVKREYEQTQQAKANTARTNA